MFQIHTTSFIQRQTSKSRGNSSRRNLRYASPVRRTSKMKGPISWSSRTAHQSRTAHHTLTLKCSWMLLSTVAWGFPHITVVCIIDIVAIELHFVSKLNVTMQLANANEPLSKFQPLNKLARSKMLHSLHVVWIHALCMQWPPHSRVGNTKTSCNSSRARTWTALHHLNNASFFIDITLGCNANAGKCTGISQCLVNSSKHSSGWYSTVRKTLLIFSYGINWQKPYT